MACCSAHDQNQLMRNAHPDAFYCAPDFRPEW
ncbi:hypothetical protein EM595_2507 [Duffyella gerundensis]|uniref:Uncharacterized protein n=1 Tax=Duffyella gerundensis TaxID=1619313 RepID=A0A0U5GPM3_9GAMM|nr:hypothetical protein EM595_2507 [Duffyella gerundensis]